MIQSARNDSSLCILLVVAGSELGAMEQVLAVTVAIDPLLNLSKEFGRLGRVQNNFHLVAELCQPFEKSLHVRARVHKNFFLAIFLAELYLKRQVG